MSLNCCHNIYQLNFPGFSFCFKMSSFCLNVNAFNRFISDMYWLYFLPFTFPITDFMYCEVIICMTFAYCKCILILFAHTQKADFHRPTFQLPGSKMHCSVPCFLIKFWLLFHATPAWSVTRPHLLFFFLMTNLIFFSWILHQHHRDPSHLMIMYRK